MSLLSRLRRRRPIPGKLIHAYDQEHLLTFGPGSLTTYEIWGKNGSTPGYDCVCPGCGLHAYQLPGRLYPIKPDAHGLTCAVEVHFTACCGWRGRLTDGEWRQA